MTFVTEKFIRKAFLIDAARVSIENIYEVAKWCDGEVRIETRQGENGKDETSAKYIKVHVHRPLNERQTKAYIGDRVLYAGSGFKVYTEKAFENSFESADFEDEDAPGELLVVTALPV